MNDEIERPPERAQSIRLASATSELNVETWQPTATPLVHDRPNHNGGVEMKHVTRKTIVAAVVPILVLVSLASMSSQAGAYCSFNNNTATLSGWKIGYEATRYASTCDNDDFYAGKLKDHSVADGASVEVQFSINFGSWFTQYYTGSTSYKNYNFQSSASTVGIRLRSANSGSTSSATIQNY